MADSTRLAQSIRQGFSSFNHWYGWLGVLVASVATANFVFSLTNLPLSASIISIISTYKAIVHAAFDWITLPFQFRIAGWAKDMIFLYCLIGGAFVRARLSERIYSEHNQSVRNALWVLFSFPLKNVDGSFPLNTRFATVWQHSPQWMRSLLDFLLWPRVAIQYCRKPMVHENDYLGTYPTFPAGYQTSKPFLYDRRVVFAIQLLAVMLGLFAIVVTNAFLTLPQSSP
jgi:hypothetical protein